MNFNFSNTQDYALNTGLIEEMIELYGILVKFILTEKINDDDTVFGDYSHLKSIPGEIYDIYMLPETTEDWDTGGFDITSFGLVNFENLVLFAAKSSFDPDPDIIDDPLDIVGNLIVLPNNKVMEVTGVDVTVPGVNNLFTYNDAKSVYKLTCKPHDFKIINEISSEAISLDPNTPYETLDNYFNELTGIKGTQDNEANVKLDTLTVDNANNTDVQVLKPIVDKTEESVWGEFS